MNVEIAVDASQSRSKKYCRCVPPVPKRCCEHHQAAKGIREDWTQRKRHAPHNAQEVDLKLERGIIHTGSLGL